MTGGDRSRRMPASKKKVSLARGYFGIHHALYHRVCYQHNAVGGVGVTGVALLTSVHGQRAIEHHQNTKRESRCLRTVQDADTSSYVCVTLVLSLRCFQLSTLTMCSIRTGLFRFPAHSSHYRDEAGTRCRSEMKYKNAL